MKKIFAISATFMSASSAMAGSLAYVAPEVSMIENPASMGGSGAWLIPLIILAVLGLALMNNDCRTGAKGVLKTTIPQC